MRDRFLSKEDYEEPCCPLKTPSHVTPIQTGRVIEKLDEYLSRNDYDAAERHLRYWLAEAENGNDMRGKLTVLNEQIGLSRKMKKEPECMQAIGAVLALADELGMEGTVTMGTTYINVATGYAAFEKTKEALPLYQKAQTIYEEALPQNDARLGGLYNNMALTMMKLGDYENARTYFQKALAVMSAQEHGEAEMAITMLNLADLVAAEVGVEAGEAQIGAYLDEAERLLDTESLPKDGNFAFVCEKCAPIFGYYGYFLTEQKLAEQAREIYERA